jgi:predicted permease
VAVFAVTASVLLNPLPYPDSKRIVVVDHHAPGVDLPELGSSSGTIDFYRGAAHQITPMAAVANTSVNLTGNGPAERIEVERVSPEFFDVVATRPARGRAFTNDDVAVGARPVVILTDASWRSRFGADPGIIGRTIELDGSKAEIVGVMPRGFAFPDEGPQALLPAYFDPQLSFGAFGFTGIARLAPGATLESARTELQTLQSRLPDRFPEAATADFLKRVGWSASMTTLQERMTRDVSAALWVLLGGVGLLLFIATANVANLFLVRAESRRREMALRTALGGGRARMAVTCLAESAVIGAAGGLLGLMIAYAGVRLLVATGPAQLPRLGEVHLSASVLVFAALITILASAVLGLVAFVATRGLDASALREGGRNATAGRERHRVRKVLIGAQVAMSLVLLVGAQLMLASVRQLRAVDPGFDPAGVLVVSMAMDQSASASAVRQFYQRVVEEAAHLPGVTAAGLTSSLPIEQSESSGGSFSIESRPRAEDALPPVAYYTSVTPGYFEAMRIPLRAGRAAEWRDSDESPRAVWVNETFARTFLDGRAVGERIRFGDDSVWATIAGVVGDVHDAGLREAVRPMAFYPIGVTAHGLDFSRGNLVLRAGSGDPVANVSALRSIVAQANPAVPVVSVRTMSDVIRASLAQTSFMMMLLTIAALVATLLGVVGLYGVISHDVGQRRKEIGVRMALGARPVQIRRMVLRQGVVLTLAGTAVGLGAALALTRLMQSLLFNVSARDPWIFAGSALVLVFVCVTAADVPARRTAGVQPLDALRSE